MQRTGMSMNEGPMIGPGRTVYRQRSAVRVHRYRAAEPSTLDCGHKRALSHRVSFSGNPAAAGSLHVCTDCMHELIDVLMWGDEQNYFEDMP